MGVDGDSMPHFGSKAKSASDTVGMVAIVPPLLPSARRGTPSLPRDATPSLVPRHGEAAPRHRPDDLLGVSWVPLTRPLDRVSSGGSTKVEGDFDGAALFLGRQGDEGVAPLFEAEGVGQHPG